MALALMCSLIVCSSFFFSNPELMVLVTAGTCIGVLLPDIHMTRPKRLKLRSFAWLIVQFPRQICAPLLCRIYAYTHHPVQDPGDKRLIHSVPGALFVFACTATILLVPASAAGNPVVTGMATVFLAGVLLGICLHLLEDLCTRKGIFPLFPFSPWTVAGSIRPCDRTDPRIGQYHIQHCTVLLVFFGLDSLGILAPSLFILLSIAGLSICLGTMVWLSDISIRKSGRMQDEKKQPVFAEQHQ
ncbi:MAG: metal-dependent hydrolase [Methanoregula sp.]|nr:metal-dependent hydrolase [Methanoregula sp.]